MSEPELHRPVAVDRVGPRGMEITVVAEAAECPAIAARLLLPAVASLSCRFQLTPAPQGRVAARGELQAAVTQSCVVSLEPFEATVAERFEVVFVPEGLQDDGDDDPDSVDEIPYAGNSIDLGEAAVEQLALALDPYPHMPGAALPEAATEAGENAFAALARLRRPE